MWEGLKAITSYKTPSPSTEANQQLSEDLNKFYCRFEKQKPGLTPHTHSDRLTTQPSTPSPPPSTVSQPVLKICEDDVSKVFRRQKIRKAKGPDGVSPACLKACAVQLSSIFTLIFNRSLELCEVPSCFKRSTIIPVPKKPKTTGRNDYRPVALTSMEMMSFERLVLAHLKDSTGPLLDPLQFAYRANRSVDDAVNMGLQSQQPGAEHAQNCRDDSGLQEKPPCTPPTHYHEQHCDCSGVIQVSGNHHLSGPEVGQSHWLHHEKISAKVVLPSSTEKVQPATGAYDTVLLCCYWVGSVLLCTTNSLCVCAHLANKADSE